MTEEEVYTQVAHLGLVKETLDRIGQDFGIEFERPSTAVMFEYPTGNWLFDVASDMSVRVSRWATGRDEGRVARFRFDEEPADYEARLENELRAEILKLHNPEDLVSICAHSLSSGPLISVLPGERHLCMGPGGDCPNTECRCAPVQMPELKYERLRTEAARSAAKA